MIMMMTMNIKIQKKKIKIPSERYIVGLCSHLRISLWFVQGRFTAVVARATTAFRFLLRGLRFCTRSLARTVSRIS